MALRAAAGRRAGSHDDQGAVHRAGAGRGAALHPSAVRAVLRRQPRRLAAAVHPDGGSLAAVRQPAVPPGHRQPLPRSQPGAAAGGRQPISQPAHRLQGQAGERVRPLLPLLRLPAEPRVSHHDHHPRRRHARLPAGAGHLPRHRRARADAHRPGLRRRAGALRRLRAHGGRDRGGHQGREGEDPAGHQHLQGDGPVLLVHDRVRPDAERRQGSRSTAAGCSAPTARSRTRSTRRTCSATRSSSSG